MVRLVFYSAFTTVRSSRPFIAEVGEPVIEWTSKTETLRHIKPIKGFRRRKFFLRSKAPLVGKSRKSHVTKRRVTSHYPRNRLGHTPCDWNALGHVWLQNGAGHGLRIYETSLSHALCCLGRRRRLTEPVCLELCRVPNMFWCLEPFGTESDYGNLLILLQWFHWRLVRWFVYCSFMFAVFMFTATMVKTKMRTYRFTLRLLFYFDTAIYFSC